MQQLLTETRPRKYLHDFPSPADLGELLSQTGIHANSALWRSADGRLLAYALVDTRYRNIYFDLRTGHEDALAPALFSWGEACVRASGDAPTLDTACPSDHAARVALLKRHGFLEQQAKTLRLTRDLTRPFEKPSLQGFTIRPLEADEAEAAVALHRAAFGTDFFTLEERRAIMGRPDYDPTLDLVAVAPDGRLAASCITTVEDDRGFTDPVCTHPAFQRSGLARALLQTAFAVLKERGVARAALTTLSTNHAALQTFAAVGFQTEGSKSWFEKPVSKREEMKT